MAYELDQFISDCRSILLQDPGPAGREEVRTQLERLLRNPDFVREHCDKARVSPPHDHGDSWAIYGQATHYTDMTEWEREDDGADPEHAKLKPAKKYRLTPGHAGIYQDGKIHSIDYPDHARFVRVTGTNLDRIHRVRFDLNTGEVKRMTPQQAT